MNIRNLALLAIVTLAVTVRAAEAPSISFVINGHSPLTPEKVDRPSYGLIETALFVGEPIVLRVSVVNANVPAEKLAEHIVVEARTEDGEPVDATSAPDLNEPLKPRSPSYSGAETVDLRMSPLPAGKYIVSCSWVEESGTVASSAEKRKLTIFRGDETPLVHSWLLRTRARTALAAGTAESYQTARTALLEAAKDSNDPSIYEELGDAAAPWASPSETADYYERSKEIAASNLTSKFGVRREWPQAAVSQFERRERKAKTFRDLLPYYQAHFDEVRVVVSKGRDGDNFVIENRSDGRQIRIVNTHE